MAQKVLIGGKKLTADQVAKISLSDEVNLEFSPRALKEAKKSFDFLQQESKKRVIYGVNTGFGPMAYELIGKNQLEELQINLIRSHAAGIGRAMDPIFVMAAMVSRLNTLAQGFSGVSEELLNRLKQFINLRIIPIVPEHGAVGTSGDLVQLAHIALCLIGEGEAIYQGKRQHCAKILQDLNIKPYKLKAKEGLALINGTSFMSGMGAILCLEAENILNIASTTAAMAMECVNAFDESISEFVQNVRPHSGQILAAAKIRRLLKSSKRLHRRSEFETSHKLNGGVQNMGSEAQEVYSIRCSPQILGPIFDTLKQTKKVVDIELNSVSDNPIIDVKGKKFLHGGNFHGDYVAAALDKLKASMVKLTMLSERRINFFMHDKKNHLFPPFLNLREPGLTLALQGLQFVATSTAAQSQTLGYPHHLHSIPTNGENQDVVSMGSDAALFAHKVIDNAYTVLAIELVTLTQAMDYTGNLNHYSKSSQNYYQKVRGHFPKLENDRFMATELGKLKGSLSYCKYNHNLLF